MKIVIIAVGKIKEKSLKGLIEEYAKRLSRFCDLKIEEVDDEQAAENLSRAQMLQVKRIEADRVVKRLKEGTLLVVLDVKGEKMDSEAFAEKIQSFLISGRSHITFVIGGTLGLYEELIQRADLRLSLSDMTFPHQLARLILLEQLFRAFKIINKEPYHK